MLRLPPSAVYRLHHLVNAVLVCFAGGAGAAALAAQQSAWALSAAVLGGAAILAWACRLGVRAWRSIVEVRDGVLRWRDIKGEHEVPCAQVVAMRWRRGWRYPGFAYVWVVVLDDGRRLDVLPLLAAERRTINDLCGAIGLDRFLWTRPAGAGA